MMVYADNAATSPMSDTAIKVLTECARDIWGNPSSLHTPGQIAADALRQARSIVAGCLHASPEEIIFTSGGTEADNQALLTGAAAGEKQGRKHIISTVFEHHAILHPLKKLEQKGFEITLLPVHENGIVRAEDLAAAIRPDTALVSVMFVNNEIGTIQPIRDLAALCREKGILFHTDAVQAVGHIPIDVQELQIDMLSLSGHKFHGPKGVGALYVRKGIRITPVLEGGGQEKNRRSGTENVPGILSMAAALREMTENMSEREAYVLSLRNQLLQGLSSIPATRINGDLEQRIAGNLNIIFEGIEGESILLLLDEQGIAASSGSACTSSSLEPSHVLLSLGIPKEIAHGSVRFSLSGYNTEEDIRRIIDVVPGIAGRLRAMSPVWKERKA